MQVGRHIQDTGDRTHQEGEEGEAQELEQDREDVLSLRLPGVISIAYSCDNLENPVERVYVQRYIVSLFKTIVKNPRFWALLICILFAWFLLTNGYINTSAVMADEYDVVDEDAEANHIFLLLSRPVLLQQK